MSFKIISISGDEKVAKVFVASANDDSNKMFEFVDGLDTRYKREEKWIINVSTQYGCPVDCRFCDAGGDYKGNIPADLMLGQVKYVLDRHDPASVNSCKKLKVHFARMGEPALNNEVIDALKLLPETVKNPGLMACVASVAPKGREKWFESLCNVKHQMYNGHFQLQLSINSTDEEWRLRLMPISLFSFQEMAEIVSEFWTPRDRKVVLNFALTKGVPVEPKSVSRFFDPEKCIIKLTPLNPTFKGKEENLASLLRQADESEADELASGFSNCGYEVVMSVGDYREDKIGSNCGQAVRMRLNNRIAPGLNLAINSE